MSERREQERLIEVEPIFAGMREGVWYKSTDIVDTPNRMARLWSQYGHKWVDRRKEKGAWIYALKPAGERPPFTTAIIDDITFALAKEGATHASAT